MSQIVSLAKRIASRDYWYDDPKDRDVRKFDQNQFEKDAVLLAESVVVDGDEEPVDEKWLLRTGARLIGTDEESVSSYLLFNPVIVCSHPKVGWWILGTVNPEEILTKRTVRLLRELFGVKAPKV